MCQQPDLLERSSEIRTVLGVLGERILSDGPNFENKLIYIVIGDLSACIKAGDAN